MKIRGRNKGITLIALIITIIVMLILVAVSIDLIVDGKLFNSAGNAVTKTNEKIGQQEKDADSLMTEWDKLDKELESNENQSNTDISQETPTSPETGESGDTILTPGHFKIDDTIYEYDENEAEPSWSEWCESEYNLDEFYVQGFYVCDSQGRYVCDIDGNRVEAEDVIAPQEYVYMDN